MLRITLLKSAYFCYSRRPIVLPSFPFQPVGKLFRVSFYLMILMHFVEIVCARMYVSQKSHPQMKDNCNADPKMWNASRFCVSSLRRGHANLLCIVPILVYVLPKPASHMKQLDKQLEVDKQNPVS